MLDIHSEHCTARVTIALCVLPGFYLSSLRLYHAVNGIRLLQSSSCDRVRPRYVLRRLDGPSSASHYVLLRVAFPPPKPSHSQRSYKINPTRFHPPPKSLFGFSSLSTDTIAGTFSATLFFSSFLFPFLFSFLLRLCSSDSPPL